MRAVVTALFVAAGIAFTAPVFAQGAGGGGTSGGGGTAGTGSAAGATSAGAGTPSPSATTVPVQPLAPVTGQTNPGGNPQCSDASGSNCPDGDFTERAAVARLCLERPSPAACAGRSARRRKLAGRDQGIGQGDRS